MTVTRNINCRCLNFRRTIIDCNGLQATKVPHFASTMVHTLILSHNAIMSVQAEDFLTMDSLRRLWLDHNNIHYLGNQTFSPVADTLFSLNISSNFLGEDFPTCTQHMFNLRQLDVSHNQITHIKDGDFKGLTRLRYLFMEGNVLLDFESGALNDIKHSLNQLALTISASYQQSIQESDHWELPHLYSVQFVGRVCPLDQWETLFSGQNRQQHIGLTDCGLTDYSNWHTISGQGYRTRLRSLRVSGNHITLSSTTSPFPTMLRLLYHLHTLDLGYNDITDLGLEKVSIFLGMHSLKVLNLQGNKLKELDAGVLSHTPNLESLNLRHNNMTSVEVYKIVNQTNDNIVIQLTGNPLHCYCDLHPLKWMIASQLQGTSHHLKAEDVYQGLMCASPHNKKGILVKDVHIDCTESKSIINSANLMRELQNVCWSSGLNLAEQNDCFYNYLRILTGG